MFKYINSLTIEEKNKYLIVNEKYESLKILDWKNSFTFKNNDELWGKKLKSLKLDETRLNDLINCDILDPDYLYFFKKKYKFSKVIKKPLFSERFTNTPLAGFFNLFSNEINQAKNNLHHKLNKINIKRNFNIDKIIELLLFNVADNLFDMISRTLVLELNVERIKGNLKGNNSEERFNYFKNLLLENQYKLDFFGEYPILFLKVKEFLKKWEKNSYILIKRLNNDWDEIIDKFGIDPNSEFIKIQINAGDKHNDGKSVTILHFTSGKIVYKPRNIDIDEHFQTLLSQINNFELKFMLKPIVVLNKKKYGWVEFIENSECVSNDQVKSYYTRLGYLMFILYILNGTDIHYENIIASGEYPVIIDLETLFNPFVISNSSKNTFSLNKKINDYIATSVLSTALLPWKSNIRGKFVDISGLTDVTQYNPEIATTSWDSEAKDNMSIVRKMIKFSPSNNTPKMLNENIDPFQYHDDIIEGFQEIGHFFFFHKQKLIDKRNGLLQLFKNDTVRVLFRNTAEYDQLVSTSFHPNFLRNSLEREILFDYLWINVENYPILEKIILSEQKSLHNMDIPIFNIKANSTVLFDSHNQKKHNFFKKSGFDLVLEKIKKFNLTDLEKQKWMINASIEPYIKPKVNNIKYDNNVRNYSALELTNLSKKIFQTLLKNSWQNSNEINWLGINHDINAISTNISPLQIDFYIGKPGIIFYNAYLYQTTKDEFILKILKKQIDFLKKEIKTLNFENISKLGMFNGGFAGIIYLYSHLFYILEDESFYIDAVELIKYLKHDSIVNCDVIEGKSGIALALISLYSIKSDPIILKIINEIGDSICENAIYTDFGCGWKDTNGKLLSGFAHGVSGIVYCLSEINKLENNNKIIEVIDLAIKYENSLYLETTNNWEDLREIEHFNSHDMTAWCNGAVGVGLSRLFIGENLNCKDKYINDLKKSIKKTILNGFGRNHTLCHGDLGTLDFLLEVNKLNSELIHKSDLDEIKNAIIKSIFDNGPICSTSSKITTFGLMTGISGIGLQLLKIAYPDIIPSILLIEKPKF